MWRKLCLLYFLVLLQVDDLTDQGQAVEIPNEVFDLSQKDIEDVQKYLSENEVSYLKL